MEQQLEEMRVRAEAEGSRWGKTISGMNEKHVNDLKLFAARAKKTYDDRLVDITKRMEDGFLR